MAKFIHLSRDIPSEDGRAWVVAVDAIECVELSDDLTTMVRMKSGRVVAVLDPLTDVEDELTAREGN